MAWNARPLIFYVFPEQVHYTLQQQTTLIVMTHLLETRIVSRKGWTGGVPGA